LQPGLERFDHRNRSGRRCQNFSRKLAHIRNTRVFELRRNRQTRCRFFGESVPELRSRRARYFLEQSNALIIVGSSLMVFSGYRFARIASQAGLPIAIVNRGTTRADDLATHKLTANCAELLSQAVSRLAA
jgi:NAD-dependent SIR2 family protein deacetylase